jgi:hypothetical protein
MSRILTYLFEKSSRMGLNPIWLLENCPAVVDQLGNLSMFLT